MRSGLLRFDGVRFLPTTSPNGQRFLSSNVTSLLAAKDGSLWIATEEGFKEHSLSHWVNQTLAVSMHAPGRILSMIEDREGAVWIAYIPLDRPLGSLCRVVGSGLQCYGTAEGLPSSLTAGSRLVEDNEGNIWIGSDTEIVRWKPGSSSTYQPSALRRNSGMDGIRGLVVAPDGSLWVGIAEPGPGGGLQRLVKGTLLPVVTSDLVGSSLDVSALLLDRQNALWIGTFDQGVYRIYGQRVDHFKSADGLSSDRVTELYEDHEGNLWVVTSAGVDNFRDVQVATYSTREGINSTEVNSVLASRDGTLWVGGSGTLVALRHGHPFPVDLGKKSNEKEITSLLEDHEGRLWVGIDNTLSVYANGGFERIDRPDGSPFGLVTSLAEDVNHNIWARESYGAKPLIRIQNRRVQEEFSEVQMQAIRKVAADPEGGVWLGLMNGDLARYRDGKIQTIHFDHQLNSSVDQVAVNPDGSVFGATAFGLVAWKAGKRQILNARNGLPCDGVNAFISDSRGSLWLYMKCGLVEITSPELQRWWERPDATLQSRVFDSLDGVQPGLAPFDQSAARTLDGRLWFANGLGLQMVDPARLIENRVLSPVHIESIAADGKSYSLNDDLRLPALTRDLEIDYTALSFVIPQKVQFRYRLEGHDAGWQDPGTRRQAFYNDLGPGKYRFHVIACNNDGLWNSVGASLDFKVEPAWFQTIWFQSLCGALAVLALWALYRFRVRQIALTINTQFDHRLEERTRLARELHDTFLQTVQGSKMVADDALDANADETRMRKALEKLSRWLGQAVEEGRAALHSLRVSTTEKNHLSEALLRATEDHQFPSSMTVAFSVIGDARDLHPIVRDEVYRIGYEAIRNAAAHSRASRLEIDLRYANDLSLRIKDNGLGIDPSIPELGREGHFGLQGMRERASRIRSKLSIDSSANAGTQVSLVVPGAVVYRNEHPTPLERLKEGIRRFFRSSRSDGI
jgi:signal transduction histidine kinase/ligand-binding sensor domain-containing protein